MQSTPASSNMARHRVFTVLTLLLSFLFQPGCRLAAQVSGSLDPIFQTGTGANAQVLAVATQADGKIVVGGFFNSINNQPRSFLARLFANGSLESTTTFNLGAGLNGAVKGIAVQKDGKIIIVGDFTMVNSQPRNRIARLNPDGTVESIATFNPGSAADASIECVRLQGDGKILIGGNFLNFNARPAQRIARLYSDGGLESAETFSSESAVAGGPVYSIALQPDGKILLGGAFQSVGTQGRNFLARLSANGVSEGLAQFNVGFGPNAPVRCVVAQTDGKILIGGDFLAVNGQGRSHIARLNVDGTLEGLNTFAIGTGVAGTVYSLCVQPDEKILVGGGFGSVNGQQRTCLARLNGDGTVENTSTFLANAANIVMSIVLQADGKILLGGQFAQVNNIAQGRVARLLNTVEQNGPIHEVLASFRKPPASPTAGPLVNGGDGYFWGTTVIGGSRDGGTVFKVKADGSDWQLMASFDDEVSERGSFPDAGLVSDGAGFLWGSTSEGGAADAGTVFKIKIASGELTTVVQFTGSLSGNRGSHPFSEMVPDGMGNLWGITSKGGTANQGTVFKIKATTGALTTLVDFSGTMGSHPRGGLANDGNGFFWGMTDSGGANGVGTLFKIDQQTGNMTVLRAFEAGFGQIDGGLVADGLGFLWGSTTEGFFKVDATTGDITSVAPPFAYGNSKLLNDGQGYFWGTNTYANGYGAIVKIEIATGIKSIAASFSSEIYDTIGGFPRTGLVSDGQGSFIGATGSGGPMSGGTVFKVNATSGEISSVTVFGDDNVSIKGNFPYTGVVADGAGYLWGTTQHGGKGHGTIFKINETSGEIVTVVEFTDKGTTNRGAEPRATLVKDGNGYFWGSTSEGGGLNGGTLFKVNIQTGELATLHEFGGGPPEADGSRPNGELVSDGQGFFWGTTYGYYAGGGTVYKVNMNTGAYTRVFTEFTSGNGYSPYAALTADGLGNFWGTTNRGGFPDDCGTIFRLSIATGALTTMAQFTGLMTPNYGREPRSKLLQDSAGDFWGITSEGGNLGRARGLGTIYKVNARTGAITTITLFTGSTGSAPGSEPRAQLIRDNTGSYWGTTWKGGSHNDGTIYRLNGTSGELTTVLEFQNDNSETSTGAGPGYGSLLLHSDGNFYGTTQEGGPGGGGTIFRLRFGPTPVTVAADDIGLDAAELHGTVNPNGRATAIAFELATNRDFTNSTTLAIPGSSTGRGSLPFSKSAPGLRPGTTYYFRIVATNSANAQPQRGATLSFTTTSNSAPVVTLLGANPLTVEAGQGSYVDAGATASDEEDGVLVPTVTANTVAPNLPGAYVVKWSATDHFNVTTEVTRIVNVVDTTAPIVTPPAKVKVGTLDPNGVAVVLPASTATDAVGVTLIVYSPPSGSVFPRGRTTVNVTALDAAGNAGTASFEVEVNLTDTVHEALMLQGAAVADTVSDPRIPGGSTWATFGHPAISAAGKVAFLGSWKTPSGSFGKGLFVDHTLLAQVGGDAPVQGTTFQSFFHPVFASESDTVLVRTILKGRNVGAGNDRAIVAFTPDPVLVIRQGAPVGVESRFQLDRLFGFAGNSDRSVVLASLRDGAAALEETESLAIVSIEPGGASIVARTGTKLLGKPLTSLRLLKSIPGTAGHGRHELSDAGIFFVALFADGTQAVIKSTGPGDLAAVATSGAPVIQGAHNVVWRNFGPGVSSSSDGAQFAFLASTSEFSGIETGIGGFPNGNGLVTRQGIFLGDDTAIERLAGVNEAAPVQPPGYFTAFQNPVFAADGSGLAFVAKTRTGLKNDTGIFAIREGSALASIATLRGTPPGTAAGTRWKSFTSIAEPGGGIGPIFTASLQLGPDVNAESDTGLWGVDSEGVLRSLAREGDSVGGKPVSAIQILQAIPGVHGSTRAFNDRAQLVWRAVFRDNTTGIIRTTVP